MSELDLVIRNGLVVDGTGAEPFTADVGIRDGKIVEVGKVSAKGREEIDAKGKLVTPGFVDIHTHYDGQAIWSERMNPSSQHGVTTVVTGNCGVGFAPCRPKDHELLVHVMEGVEDIPEIVMTAGLDWDWETFPEYLDAVDKRKHDIDVAAYLPHSALRVYVMGERGANREDATEEDLAKMKKITREAIEAGGIGFATSRLFAHRTIDGDSIPSFDASERELTAISSAVGEAGKGCLQLVLGSTIDFDLKNEVKMVRRLVEKSGRPASFTMVQENAKPDKWRDVMAEVNKSNEDGLTLKAQIFPRPVGLILGFNLSINPVSLCPSYKALEKLPVEERMRELRKPEVREKLLGEAQNKATMPILAMGRQFDLMYPLDLENPNYEPDPETSFAAMASKRNTSALEMSYDYLAESPDRMILVTLANYPENSLDKLYEIMHNKDSVLGLGDGGAHYGMICDASYPTFVLQHWTRDRTRGKRIPLADAVKALTSVPAKTVGFMDRGIIAPGYKADINVINYDKLKLEAPTVVYDLPAGGRRLMQGAKGFEATIVSGQTTYRDGVPTGALPGKLVRGAQPAPH